MYAVTATGAYGLYAQSSAEAGTGVQAFGHASGVAGISSDGIGVRGLSTDGVGVSGEGSTGANAVGVDGPGVFARSESGAGVDAESRNGTGVFATARSGGFGLDAFSLVGTGLRARSFSGSAVEATTTSQANTNPVVRATSTSKGGAIAATTSGVATNPAIKATSGVAAQAAIQAVGRAVPAGPAVALAGNATAAPGVGHRVFRPQRCDDRAERTGRVRRRRRARRSQRVESRARNRADELLGRGTRGTTRPRHRQGHDRLHRHRASRDLGRVVRDRVAGADRSCGAGADRVRSPFTAECAKHTSVWERP